MILPSVNYCLVKSKMATFKMAFLCYVASKHHFVPVVTFDQPYIFEGDRDNFRFTTVQPPRNHCPGGRRIPHVCEFATERLVH